MEQQTAGVPAFSELDGWGLARRRVVRALALVPTAVGGSFALGACSAHDAPGPDGRPLLALSAAQARTLEAVAEAVAPTAGGFPSAREAEVMRRFDEELSFVSPSIRDDLKAALGVLEYLPPLYGHFGRFSHLDRSARQALLQQMCSSRVELLRAIGGNVKILVQFFYFAHPKTWAATGYDGPFGRLPERMDDQRRWYAEHTGASA
ncbi:hypothetical protein E4T66_02510 [Sinimarinibacterium sp. CAU 1509]|uniref:hypothetical protein n=1 Tax=Sinimarinibacterium sp. CAU 1509 TaxID=2562283 RepID=UPI0010AC0D97|nr:hypothetical protein [Sinimarinibacterium sp. CAU 1509]TJY65116.1 hypothetical protein E4T66_02510 [Sinimarinibacterium sp. CAU 1509]